MHPFKKESMPDFIIIHGLRTQYIMYLEIALIAFEMFKDFECRFIQILNKHFIMSEMHTHLTNQP